MATFKPLLVFLGSAGIFRFQNFIFFQLLFYHVHPFSKVKKEKEYVLKMIKKKNGKWSKIAALPRGCVWVLQALKVLSKSLFETSK